MGTVPQSILYPDGSLPTQKFHESIPKGYEFDFSTAIERQTYLSLDNLLVNLPRRDIVIPRQCHVEIPLVIAQV